mmetsp:Transcript_51459/g.143869  ORF Transcript_51459/g.143869 Transcript_51459/m.143869 type:complete len:278 (-) Transcript_51459:616-1449(-)
MSLERSNHLVDRVHNPADVIVVEAGERDPPRREQVDVVFVDQSFALHCGQTCASEHPHLLGDVLPLSWRALRLEAATERSPELDESVHHLLQLPLPLGAQVWVAQYPHDEPGSMDRGARVHGPYHRLEVRQHNLGTVLACAHNVQHADALAIEAHVLREGLGNKELELRLVEDPNRQRVPVEVPRSETLVRAVDDRDEVLDPQGFQQVAPLELRQVHARGVVRAGLEQHHAPRCRLRQLPRHRLEIQGLRLLVPVGVRRHREPTLLEEHGVVPPSGL